jgi:hypothetical protein
MLALWGTRVSPSTVSDLNKKIYRMIEAWRNRPIEGDHPYISTASCSGAVGPAKCATSPLLVAIGVNWRGYLEILGICEGAKAKSSWSSSISRTRVEGCPADHLGCLHWACREHRRVLSRGGPGEDASCTGTATSSVTFPQPRCGRSRPCSRRSRPARTSRQRARRPSDDREAACRRAGGSGDVLDLCNRQGGLGAQRLPLGAFSSESVSASCFSDALELLRLRKDADAGM